MSTAVADKALLQAPEKPSNPENSMIVRVARERGVSPFRQFAQIVSLRRKVNGLDADEYYGMGVFQPEMSASQRREFVGRKGNLRLNRSLTHKNAPAVHGVISSKLMLEALLRDFGLPTTRTDAIFHSTGKYGARRVLRTVDDVAKFMRKEAEFPLFAKPARGSLSVGSALLESFDDARDALILGNGASVAVETFAAEIVNEHSKGFLFQQAVTQHPDVSRVAGATLGSVRVVTIAGKDSPQTLYTVWKLPAPTAMSDNAWQDGSIIAHVDHQTGRVLEARRGTDLAIEVIDTHPVSGLPLRGFELPVWQDVIRAAERAHALFPYAGVLGWDIGISAEGPVILETNENPFHMLYQRATGRGILNPGFLSAFEVVRARNAERFKGSGRLFKRISARFGKPDDSQDD